MSPYSVQRRQETQIKQPLSAVKLEESRHEHPAKHGQPQPSHRSPHTDQEGSFSVLLSLPAGPAAPHRPPAPRTAPAPGPALTAISVLLRPCCSPLAASASSPLAPVLSALPATAAAGGGGAGGGGAGGGCRCLPARLALVCRQRWCRAKVCWRSSSRRSGDTAW